MRDFLFLCCILFLWSHHATNAHFLTSTSFNILPLQEAQTKSAERRGRSTQTPGVENAFCFDSLRML